MIDWLANRPSRLTAFFLLYLTEGLPLGYAAVFVVTLMRREGVSPTMTGAFTALFYLPWSFKWAAGPFIDVFQSRRFGARRPWITVTQLLMTLTYSSLIFIHLGGDLSITDVQLFSIVILIANVFGSIQDVAIDALAIDALQNDERGLANGMMFAGAAVGNAIGGSGALFLYDSGGFTGSTMFVLLCLLAVLVLVSSQLRERGNSQPAVPLSEIGTRLRNYLVTAKNAFFGSRMGTLGVVLALLPAGGYAMGLVLQQNLSAELGMSDDQIAWLTIASTAVFASFCIIGGLLSDHWGRLRCLCVYILLTTVPTLAFAAMMQQAGWIMPIDTDDPNHPIAGQSLLHGFWAMTMLFSMFNGLMYGTRSAFFMDFCDPAVAATQFTAYMALMNLVIAYSAFWIGYASDNWGYPMTLVLDAVAGILCLTVLAAVPWARRKDAEHTNPDYS